MAYCRLATHAYYSWLAEALRRRLWSAQAVRASIPAAEPRSPASARIEPESASVAIEVPEFLLAILALDALGSLA